MHFLSCNMLTPAWIAEQFTRHQEHQVDFMAWELRGFKRYRDRWGRFQGVKSCSRGDRAVFEWKHWLGVGYVLKREAWSC
jgi:hypothetical protein